MAVVPPPLAGDATGTITAAAAAGVALPNVALLLPRRPPSDGKWEWLRPRPCSVAWCPVTEDISIRPCDDTTASIPQCDGGGPLVLLLPHFTALGLRAAATTEQWVDDVAFIRTVLVPLAIRGCIDRPAVASFALARIEASCAVSVDRDCVATVRRRFDEWTRVATATAGAAAPRAPDGPPYVARLRLVSWRDCPLYATGPTTTRSPVGSAAHTLPARLLRHERTVHLTRTGPLPLNEVVKAMLCRPSHSCAAVIRFVASPAMNGSAAAYPSMACVAAGPLVHAWILDGVRTAEALACVAAATRQDRRLVLRVPGSGPVPRDHRSLGEVEIAHGVVMPAAIARCMSLADASDCGLVAMGTMTSHVAIQQHHANAPLLTRWGSFSASRGTSMRDDRRSEEGTSSDDAQEELGPTGHRVAPFEPAVAGRFYSLGIPCDRRQGQTESSPPAAVGDRGPLRPVATSCIVVPASLTVGDKRRRPLKMGLSGDQGLRLQPRPPDAT